MLTHVIENELRAELKKHGIPIVDIDDLDKKSRKHLREYFSQSVQPILTPLAVDAEHPFPFISNHGLNLAVLITDDKKSTERFVRIKVPANRPRWVPLPDEKGFVPIEQIISSNLDLMFPSAHNRKTYLFRVTRGAEGEPARELDATLEDALKEPGSIIRLVSSELKARRFAGIVRLQVDERMPKKRIKWLASQLKVDSEDIYPLGPLARLSDLLKFHVSGREDLRYPRHEPVTHPRLSRLAPDDPSAIFDEIRRGDVLLHHPYHSFDTSVLRFLESAARDPSVLAIKVTIYRTSPGSPIVKALVDAVRRGKQAAVLVEVTARFDEAPNIAWGEYLEKEGVHVAYGVERLKTHVKLALVVREEKGAIRRYVHVGTGNYHTGTARIYEDVGLLTCDPEICDDAAAVFNALTGAMPHADYQKLLVAPVFMRERFVSLIRREAENAKSGKPAGIRAKMNQLQDQGIIRELYEASRAGVPITIHVRGLCCLRPGVPGLSDNIRVVAVVGRFLEHSRIFEFSNAGDPEYFIGSADWMRRNLDRRVETIAPVLDENAKKELSNILDVYDGDNSSAWDGNPDGTYTRRSPGGDGEPAKAAQDVFIALAEKE
jgi:polyphosphate kinase